MSRRASAAITTACVGMAMGAAAYMMSSSNNKNAKARAKKIKKTAGAAIRQVGDFIDNVSYMMK